jgi:hypothetical protein
MGCSTDDKSRIWSIKQGSQRITGMKTMQIVYHIGANCTDQDRLLKSVLKNANTFATVGVKAPSPGKYRRLIRETIQSLDGNNLQLTPAKFYSMRFWMMTNATAS